MVLIILLILLLIYYRCRWRTCVHLVHVNEHLYLCTCVDVEHMYMSTWCVDIDVRVDAYMCRRVGVYVDVDADIYEYTNTDINMNTNINKYECVHMYMCTCI